MTSTIHAAVLKVATHFAKEGIDKDATNKSQNYKYRGIDRVLNEFSTPLAEAGLTLKPAFSNMHRIVQKTKNGEGWLVDLEGTFTFTDGSNDYTIGPFFGEAFDSMDKAVSKAQSVAFRNAMLLTFCVPLGKAYDPDADDADDEPPFKVEPQCPPDPEKPAGIFLGKGQEKWIMDRALLTGIADKEQLLRNFRRIDAENAKDIGAKLADKNFVAKP